MSNKKELDLIDILLILARNKSKIFWFTFIVSLLSVAYALLVTQEWSSRTLVQPLSAKSGLDLSSLGSSLLGGLGGSLGIGENDIQGEQLVAVIYSRPFLEKIIKRFDLYTYYKLKRKKGKGEEVLRDVAIKSMKKKMITVDYIMDTGLLEVIINTKDKNLSADIANYIIQELDKYNKYDRLTKAKESRLLLEKRLAELNRDIQNNQDLMAKFQTEHKVLDIGEQTKMLISEYVNIETERKKKEISLELMKTYLQGENPSVVNLQTELSILDKSLKDYEKQNTNSYIIALNNIPELAKTYLSLESKLEIDKKVYEFLYPQLEASKLEESKEAPTLNIIETAVPAGLRTWPKRAILCVGMFMLAVLLSCSYVIIAELLKVKFEENPEIKERLVQVKNALISKK